MKISHRLAVLSLTSAVALAGVGGVGLYSLKSVQENLNELTTEAVPLKIAILELTKSAEETVAATLSLSNARSQDEVSRLSRAVDEILIKHEQNQAQISRLDSEKSISTEPLIKAGKDVEALMSERMGTVQTFESAAESARQALRRVNEAVNLASNGVSEMADSAGERAKNAQVETMALVAAEREIGLISSQLQTLHGLAYETAAASSKFRLGPIRERIIAALDGLTAAVNEASKNASLKTAMPDPNSLKTDFLDESKGLLAVRADLFSDDSGAKSRYRKAERGLLKALDQSRQPLASLADDLKLKIVLEQQSVQGALALTSGPSSITSLARSLSLQTKDLRIHLDELVNANDQQGIRDSIALTKADIDSLNQTAEKLYQGLALFKQPALIEYAQQVVDELARTKNFVATVATGKERLLASNAELAEKVRVVSSIALDEKTMINEYERVTTERLHAVDQMVDDRVASSSWMILLLALGAIFASVVFSFITIRGIMVRLNQAVDVAEAVSQGRLSPVPESDATDEVAALLRSLNRMVQMLSNQVYAIRTASSEVNLGSESISRGNNDLSARTEQQASHLIETSSQMQQIKEDVNNGAEAARKANDLARTAYDAASVGSEVVQQAVSTMREIEQGAEAINKIITAIDSIAFQTNILALNAAVEAARAGDQGRGFAVVASEVRLLARQSKESAAQIGEIIAGNVRQVGAGAALVNDAGQKMEDILVQVKKVSSLVEEVSETSHRQVESISQINMAISDLENMTQQNAALTEQSSAEAMRMLEQARALDESVGVFNVQVQSSEVSTPDPSTEGEVQ